MLPPMHVHAIPAFADNYLWLIVEGQQAVVVDPGDAAPVQAFVRDHGLRLDAILITHHHPDHVGGIAALREQRPVPVYGPRAEAARIPQLTHPLGDGDAVTLLGRRFAVMSVPGHTLGHLAYYAAGAPGLLLCGDTLFSAGCGRLFEGTPAQMHASLQRLAALPDETLVYCTHEYTLANLAFAAAVEPDNTAIHEHARRVRTQREAGLPSLPTTLRLERQINPFLRTSQTAVRTAAAAHASAPAEDDIAVFATLRQWKDGFRPA